MVAPASASKPELPEYLRPVCVLSQGVYGAVWRVEDTRRGRAVAVRLLEDAASGPSRASRIEAANRLSTIDHEGLAAIYEVATFRSTSYIELELVEGVSLGSRVALGQGMAAEEVSRIGRAIASALDAAHAIGVVHGDLTPANVLFTEEGALKLIDFRFIVGDRSSYPPDARRESRSYVAPEFRDEASVLPAVDVYALGAILYEMLGGRAPTSTERVADLTRAIASAQSADVVGDAIGAEDNGSTLRAPSGLLHLVRQCLSEHVEGRLASAAEVVRAFDSIGATDANGGTEAADAAGERALRVTLAPAISARRMATTLSDESRRASQIVDVRYEPRGPGGTQRVVLALVAGAGFAMLAAAARLGLSHRSSHPRSAQVAAGSDHVPVDSSVSVHVASEPQGALVYIRGGAVLGRTPADLVFARTEAAEPLVVRFPSGELREVPLTTNRAAAILVVAHDVAPRERD